MRWTASGDEDPPAITLSRPGFLTDPVLRSANYNGTILPSNAFFLIHGYNTRSDKAELNYLHLEYNLEQAARRPLPLSPVRVLWPGFQGDTLAPSLYFARSAVIAARCSETLTKFILKRLHELGPEPRVVLVAHSLGCLLAVLTAAKLLAQPQEKRPQVALILMAAAVPITYDFSSIMSAHPRAVLYSHTDGTLKVAFRLGQFLIDRTWTEAVGLKGFPANGVWKEGAHMQNHNHTDYWQSNQVSETLCKLLGITTERSPSSREIKDHQVTLTRELDERNITTY